MKLTLVLVLLIVLRRSQFSHGIDFLLNNRNAVQTLNFCGFIAGVNNSILNTNDRFVVPVTKAEFAVMKTAFSVRYDLNYAFSLFYCYYTVRGPKTLTGKTKSIATLSVLAHESGSSIYSLREGYL